jgi:hypothetical protein
MVGPSADLTTEWEGGSLSELVAALQAAALPVRIEVIPPGTTNSNAGEVHLLAGGLSDAFAGSLRRDDAMAALQRLEGARYIVEARLPDPETGSLSMPGPPQGSLKDRPVASLMRYCEDYVLTCRLEVWRGEERAVISYQRGEIVSTSVGGADGSDRLPEVMGWADGSYEIVLAAPVLPPSPARKGGARSVEPFAKIERKRHSTLPMTAGSSGANEAAAAAAGTAAAASAPPARATGTTPPPVRATVALGRPAAPMPPPPQPMHPPAQSSPREQTAAPATPATSRQPAPPQAPARPAGPAAQQQPIVRQPVAAQPAPPARQPTAQPPAPARPAAALPQPPSVRPPQTAQPAPPPQQAPAAQKPAAAQPAPPIPATPAEGQAAPQQPARPSGPAQPMAAAPAARAAGPTQTGMPGRPPAPAQSPPSARPSAPAETRGRPAAQPPPAQAELAAPQPAPPPQATAPAKAPVRALTPGMGSRVGSPPQEPIGPELTTRGTPPVPLVPLIPPPAARPSPPSTPPPLTQAKRPAAKTPVTGVETALATKKAPADAAPSALPVTPPPFQLAQPGPARSRRPTPISNDLKPASGTIEAKSKQPNHLPPAAAPIEIADQPQPEVALGPGASSPQLPGQAITPGRPPTKRRAHVARKGLGEQPVKVYILIGLAIGAGVVLAYWAYWYLPFWHH